MYAAQYSLQTNVMSYKMKTGGLSDICTLALGPMYIPQAMPHHVYISGKPLFLCYNYL